MHVTKLAQLRIGKVEAHVHNASDEMTSVDTQSELQRAILATQTSENPDRFRDLYEHVVDDVFRYTRPRVAQRADAHDVTQRILVELWKALSGFTYQSDKQFYGFLYTIAKRQLARYYKEEKRAGQIRESDYHEPIAMLETESLDAAALTHEALRRLSQKEQDVIILRYWQEYSFAEIGDTLQISEQTARVRHHRAMAKLEKFVAKEQS